VLRDSDTFAVSTVVELRLEFETCPSDVNARSEHGRSKDGIVDRTIDFEAKANGVNIVYRSFVIILIYLVV